MIHITKVSLWPEYTWKSDPRQPGMRVSVRRDGPQPVFSAEREGYDPLSLSISQVLGWPYGADDVFSSLQPVVIPELSLLILGLYRAALGDQTAVAYIGCDGQPEWKLVTRSSVRTIGRTHLRGLGAYFYARVSQGELVSRYRVLGSVYEVTLSRDSFGLDFCARAAFQVFVKTLAGKTRTKKIYPETPVQALIESLIADGTWDLESAQGEMPRLIHAGHQLDSQKLAVEYLLSQGSTIHLTGRLRGSGLMPLFFSNMRAVALNALGERSKLLGKVGVGLNLLCRCSGKGCEWASESIWVNLGLGLWHLGESRADAHCPSCETPFEEVLSCGLLNCHYEVEGWREGDESPTKGAGSASPHLFVSYEYHQQVRWRFLSVTTRCHPPGLTWKIV